MSEFTTTHMRGSIMSNDTLRGVISTKGNMVGMMFSKLYMNGSVSDIQHLEGVAASSMAYNDSGVYDGVYEVIPAPHEQILYTINKKMEDNVTVYAIPYSQVINDCGGYTVTIL